MKLGWVRRGGAALLVVILVLAALTGAFWLVNRPRPAGPWTGDPALVAALGQAEGLHEASVVVVERGGPPRFAALGAGPDRPFEIGSSAKTFLGLLLVDAEARGELRLTDRLDRWLPELGGAPAGELRLEELASHTSGLPSEGEGSRLGLCWIVGSGCLAAGPDQVLAELGHARLQGRGFVRYSNLGAAAAGLALSRATGRAYPDLVRERLAAPLRLAATLPQTPASGPRAPRGHQPIGTRPGNLVLDGYLPAGGYVSTTSDLARYLAAALDGRLPLPRATEGGVPWPDAPTIAGITDVASGRFWFTGRLDGRRVAFHTGSTPGYRSVIVVDPERGRAVAVLADVDTPVGAWAVRALGAS